ncbi:MULTISPECIES: hypothetical protein [unclassified Brevundimonas]|uniref:hypothetical protein n=1 Tax=unclassified Brevundimonas TaxID=2622653 RepID=UPI0025BB7461|nr:MULTISPECIES: hypothetical protein [unclassified Brevundimonas]
MALTDDDVIRLARLRADRDAQISGRAVSKVASNGRSKDMAAADLKRLDGEIEALEAKALTGRSRRRGAITFRWGR